MSPYFVPSAVGYIVLFGIVGLAIIAVIAKLVGPRVSAALARFANWCLDAAQLRNY